MSEPIEYPKMLYEHGDVTKQKIVNSVEEEMDAGDDWHDTPVDVDDTPVDVDDEADDEADDE